ncbi:hypothetical protein Neosp_002874 [[Neocosmospora] mangrovei]
MGLRLLAGTGSFSIQPALQVERVVKYTSPGFEIIWRLRRRLIKVDEACIAFRLLAREDPTLELHVDPSGSSYIEDDEMKRRLNGTGFTGMTPLHDAVLFGKFEDVQHWSTRSKKNERNFLGQTPLHLAVTRPQHLQVIVDAGHDPNAFDQNKATPLLYAAVYDEIEAARILIRAGADPFVRQYTHSSDFAMMLIKRENWGFIMDFFRFLDDEAMQTTAEMLTKEIVFLLFVCPTTPTLLGKGDYLSQLLSRCKSLNSPLELPSRFLSAPRATRRQVVKGRNLLHYARSVKEVDALLGLGLSIVNHVDQEGQHALMSVINMEADSHLEPILKRLLDAGADINLQDRRGHTACHILMQHLSNAGCWIFDTGIDCLHTLVTLGAGSLISDNCRCSCSVSGCLPATPERDDRLSDFQEPRELSVILLMEWSILILETCGIETAKKSILGTIRRIEHNKLGMTHTCCGRKGYPTKNSTPKPMPEGDIEDILEEEIEFIRILDEKMEHESNRDINSLLQSAILDTKPPTHRIKRSPDTIRDRVDHQNDRFVIEYEPPQVSEYAPDDGIASYALWLEKRFRKSKSSEQTAANPWRDSYLRRLSWLHFLCNAMEVSTEELADEFRYHAEDFGSHLYRRENIDEDAQHFFQSWAEWSAKGPAMGVGSIVGFADWPLKEARD